MKYLELPMESISWETEVVGVVQGVEVVEERDGVMAGEETGDSTKRRCQRCKCFPAWGARALTH